MWLHQIKIEEMCANMNCVEAKLLLIGIQTLIQHNYVGNNTQYNHVYETKYAN